MADLIERAAALNALCETAELGGCVEHPKNNGFCKPGNRYCDEGKAIDSIPAVDAVEVVRCRKCTKFAQNPVAWTDDRPIICFSNDPEGFCHNGTPREEDRDGNADSM